MSVVGPETRRRTVRARITAVTVVVVGATLALGGVGVVALVRSSLERPMHGEARARAADVLAQATTGVWPRPLRPVAAPWPTLVQVLGETGIVLAAHDELGGRTPLLVPTPADREPTGEATLTANGRTNRWRLDAVRADWRGVPVTVVVATSLARSTASRAWSPWCSPSPCRCWWRWPASWHGGWWVGRWRPSTRCGARSPASPGR